MSINQRVKEVRQAVGLSQAKFSKGISISNGYIAGIELEKRKVNDRIVKLICVTYDVNETWLRTGGGDMFVCAPDARSKHIVGVFQNLRPEFQDYALWQMDRLLELQQKQAD